MDVGSSEEREARRGARELAELEETRVMRFTDNNFTVETVI